MDQAKFDEIVTDAIVGVLKQGGPAMSLDGTCEYRAGDGRKCVVGQIIKDEHYNVKIEGKTVVPPIWRDEPNVVLEVVEKSVGEKLTVEQVQMLDALQNWHDGCDRDTPVEDMIARLYQRYDVEELPIVFTRNPDEWLAEAVV